MGSQRWYGPQSVGATFTDLRKHLPTTYLTAAILGIPLMFGIALRSSGSMIAGTALYLLGLLIVGVWLHTAIIKATWLYATGSDPGVAGLIDQSADAGIWRFLGARLLVRLLQVLAVAVAMSPVVVVLIATGAAAGVDSVSDPRDLERLFTKLISGPTALLLILTFVVGALIAGSLAGVIAMRYLLAGQVAVLERRTALESLRRAGHLMSHRWFDALVMLAIVAMIAVAAGVVLGIPAFMVTMAPAGAPSIAAASALVLALSSYLNYVLIKPLWASVKTNYYLAVRSDEVASATSALELSQPEAPLLPER